MSLFQQIVPRLSRSFSRSESNPATAEPADSGYTVKPAYELQESAEAWGLTVQLPGVLKDGLEISAEEGLLTVRGRRAWQKPDGWTALYRETVDAPYLLTLEHDNSVNMEKIHAELKDGVLRVSLPKTESLKPRKISVN